MVVFISDI